MTIALSILTSDGVALAADTQETDGYFKGFALKIHSATTQDFGHSDTPAALAITGAGHAVYLDVIAAEIIQRFRERQSRTIRDFEADLKTCVEDFHSKHVIPLPAHLAREVRLIVGTQIAGDSALWMTDASAVKRSSRFEAVGTAHPYARMAIQNRALMLSAEGAAVLSGLGVEHAKKYDQDWGQETTVTFLKNNRCYRVPWYLVKEAERLFSKYAGTEQSAFFYAIGVSSVDDAQRPRKVGRWLRGLRKEFMQLAGQFIKHIA